jgi:RimJ/RimL family protein N-acetyltransferase
MTAPTLETERLILRDYQLSDFAAHAAIWSDPRTTRHFGGYQYDEETAWLRFLRNWGQWALFGYGYWGLIEKATNRYIGAAGFFQARRAMDLPYRDLPEAGWVIHPDFHGRGLAGEALKTMMAWGDAHIGAPETWCMIAPGNLISRKVAERLGYVRARDSLYKGEPIFTFLRKRLT